MRRAALPLILLIGLLLRLLYLGEVAALPFFDHPIGDSAVHLARAREILAGAFVPARAFFYGSALYPYLLAGLLALPLGSLYLVGLVQCVAGVVTAWLLGRSAGHLYGEKAGLVAAGITVLYGPFAFLEADLLGVCWGLLALSAAIYFLARRLPRSDGSDPIRKSGLGEIVAAGICLGLAAAERPNLILLVVPAAAWLASSRRWVAAIVLVAGGASGLAPIVLLDRAASGDWSLPGTSSGINLYVGNNPRATGTYDEPWAEEASHFTARYTDLEESSLKMASRLAGRDLAPAEASRFWRDRAVAWALAEPASALRLAGRKAVLLWNAAEVPNHLNFAFLRSRAPALWLMPLGFGVVATLAVAGAILSLIEEKRREGAILLVLLALTAAASVLPFFVADRYRAPMVVPMIVLAAAGGTEILKAIADPRARGRSLGVALTPALLLGAATQIPMLDPDLSRDHWLFAQAYRARGDLAAARAEYEAAIGEAGEDGVLLNNLAMVQRAMGSRGEAEATLRRAMKADPALAFPHKNLGLLLLGSEASRAEALRELQEAARLDPDDAETQGALAALYAERGDRAEAIAAYTKARRLDPNDPRPARLAEQYTFLTEDSDPSTSPRARP